MGLCRRVTGPGPGCPAVCASLALAALAVVLAGCGAATGDPGSGTPNSSLGAIGGNRERPGTIFIRGTVGSISKIGFTYTSPTKGTFMAVTSTLTTYTIKEKAVSPLLVVVGTHVGVHGYLHGTRITAVRVTIYPSKHPVVPKEKTYRGTELKVGGDWIELAVGQSSYHFVLARDAPVIYRYLPTSLTTAKPGQRVDVRAYFSAGTWHATRVQLLVQEAKHPRTVTEYGIVTASSQSGFTLNTISGQTLQVAFAGQVATSEEVSVHGWPVGQGFHASKIYPRTSLPVHTTLVRGLVASVGSDWLTVTVGTRRESFFMGAFTHVTAALSDPSHGLKSGLYVSVRSWPQGARRVASSIHIYKSIPVPEATGEVKGPLIKISGDVVAIGTTRRSTSVEIPTIAKIRDGEHLATFATLAVGQTISARYYVSSGVFIATSVHIYVSEAALKTRTGTVVSIGNDSLQMIDRGVDVTVNLAPTSVIANNGKLEKLASLKPGMRIRVSGVLSGLTTITAHRIDVLVLTLTNAGHQPQSFHGVVTAVSATRIRLTLTSGTSVSSVITPTTTLLVHNRAVPISWLFAGPTATVSVAPGASAAVDATQILFHPLTRTVTGNVSSLRPSGMSLTSRTATVSVALNVASITDDGSPSTSSALLVGLKAAVDGFVLPDGIWAALTVAITHPSLRISGLVTAVNGQVVTIQRTSGEVVLLHFPTGLTASDAKTSQQFQSAQIPLGVKVSVEGKQEAGFVLVTVADLTLKSSLLHGTVTAIDLVQNSVTVTLTTDESIIVYTAALTKFTIGRDVAEFSDIEVNDTLSIRAYPDATGGVIASSIDMQRKLLERTGFVSDLSATSFALILHDSSIVTVNIQAYTEVLLNDQDVPLSELTDGEKVKVEGHLRPDGSVDATKITLES